MSDPADPKGTALVGLDPEALARFGRLELLARLVVEGVMSGLHRSPFKGFSVEFAEHRQYGPGDEIRHIDWRTFGKTDRYYVKEYEEETNLKAHLVLDTSGSMAYAGQAGVSKLEQARRVAAALSYLMIGQRDAVGLIESGAATGPGADPTREVPPRTTPGHFGVLCRALEQARTGGEAALSATLDHLAARVRRRGLLIILSDGFDDLDALGRALRHLRHRRHEVLFIQVLAEEEETFPFRTAARFRDLERDAHEVPADPSALRAGYLKRFEEHCAGLRERCLSVRADFHKITTGEDVGLSLLAYLAERSRR
jgi:uncharacterized protein (DUF58 family)